MTVRTIDEIFRDFVTDGVPASGPFNPHKPDIRDTLKAVTEGSENFPDNRVIRLNNANEGTPNDIVVTTSVAIPAAAYQVLYILNVTQENTGPVTISGAINRALVTNINQPVPDGYLTPGMALLCVDTGSELRLLSYGDAEAIAQAAEDAAAAAIAAKEAAESAAGALLSSFDTKVAIEAANIPNQVNYVRTAGYSTVGDGGAALYMRVASEPPHIGKVRSLDGAWWELAERVLRPEMFGIKGDGGDETTLLQGMFDFAGGKEVVLPYGATYGITAITLPVGLRLKAKGASFTKLAASTSYAISIPGFVTFDNIILTTPGGGDDRGVRVNGDFVTGEVLQAVATAEANGYGVRIEGTSLSLRITNISINKITTGNFSSHIQAFYVSRIRIGDIRMTGYVTGFYLRDVFSGQFPSIYASVTHSGATGTAGNNGVLMESFDANYGLDNVSFGKVAIRDSGEHAFRIGGNFIMRDVSVQSLSTYNTGALATSTGGAAFKVLLDASNSGMHEGIRVESLYFEDCSNSTAALVNQTAVQVHRVRGGYVNNIIGRKKSKTYSCRFGIQVGSCEGFTFSNPDIIDVERQVFNPLVPAGYPADMKDVVIYGGRLAASTLQTGGAVVLYEPGTGVFTNVSMRGTVIENGRCAIRYETPGSGGNYVDCVFEGQYKHGNGTSGAAGPFEGSANLILMNAKSPFYGTMVAKDASIWQDTTNNLVKIRKAGAWTTL